GMDEIDRAAPNHLRRLVAQNGSGTWAHLNEIALRVGYQDEVLRGLEHALTFLDLVIEGLLRSLAFAEIARGLGGADDLAARRSDRRDAQGDIDRLAILVDAHRFVLLDGFAATDPCENFVDFAQPVRRDD